MRGILNEQEKRDNRNFQPRRVLIFRGGALGDFVVTLPLLAEIRRNWQGVRMTIAGYSPARLALAGGLAEEWRSLDEAMMHGLFLTGESADPVLSAWVAGFDLVLCLLHDPDGVIRRNVGLTGDARWVAWSPLPVGGHVVDHFLQVLNLLGLPVREGLAPQIRLSPEILEEGRKQMEAVGRPLLAIHPGSGSARKNWPLDCFLWVAEQVRAAGGEVVFFLGEAEESVAGKIKSEGWQVRQNLDLLRLAGQLKAADGYLGNDSGVTHVAAALGLPVVALFGPTDPAVWAPRGPKVRVLKSRHSNCAMAGIPPQDVLEALLSLGIGLPKRP